ncbi:hypothetical protein EON67_07675 [archaeon]|nr:MAG: hypothetical protein EON67_07675 [archaeon]
MQGLEASKYKNVFDCALQIAKNEVRARVPATCVCRAAVFCPDELARVPSARARAHPPRFTAMMLPRRGVQGLRGFYKGATARLTRVCLDVTVVMVLYEQLTKVLDRVWPPAA